MWNLIVTGPNHPPQRKPMPADGTLLVGRSDENEVVLASESVSRRHAQLWVSKEGVQIADLGSRNGTALNGRRLGSVPRSLLPSDVATIGVYTLKVERAWDKANAATTPDPFLTIVNNALAGEPTAPPRQATAKSGLNAEPSGVEALGKLAVALLRDLGNPVQSALDHAKFLKDSALEIGRLAAKQPSAHSDQLKESAIADLLVEIPQAATCMANELARLKAMVDAARDFSNMMAVESAEVDPNRIVSGAVELVRGAYSSRIDFEVQLADLAALQCSPRMLYRALFTVLECATRMLEKSGHSKIRVETAVEPTAFSINVNEGGGAGSDQEALTTQTISARETALMSVEQMLRAHGGSFTVNNELGPGRTFCLRLPVQPAAAQKPPSTAVP